MREQLRIGSGLSWMVAWLLAFAGPTMYLVWPSTLMWWVAMALLLPIVGLASWREYEKGYANHDDAPPWSPPPTM